MGIFLTPTQQHHWLYWFLMFFSIGPQMCKLFSSYSPNLTPSNRHLTLSTQLNQSSSFFHRLFTLISYFTHRNADLQQALLYCAASLTCLLISCLWLDFTLGSWALSVPCLTLSWLPAKGQRHEEKDELALPRVPIYSASHQLTFFLPSAVPSFIHTLAT